MPARAIANPRQAAQARLFARCFGGPVLQAAWERANPQSDALHRWDMRIGGKRWHYWPDRDMYYFVVEEPAELDVMAHDEFFTIRGKLSETEYEEKLRVKIMGVANQELEFQRYFTEEEYRQIKEPGLRFFPETRPAVVHGLDYLLGRDDAGLEKACAALFDGRPFTNATAQFSIAKNFRGLAHEQGFGDIDKNGESFGLGRTVYRKAGEAYEASARAHAQDPISTILNKAVWSGLGLETESLTSDPKAAKSTVHVLAQGDAVMVGPVRVCFTRRVLRPEDRLRACGAVERFIKTVGGTGAAELMKAVESDMGADFKAALKAKDESINARGDEGARELTAKAAAGNVSRKQIEAYCVAVVNRWRGFLSMPLAVVFDSAGLKDVYGKTPSDRDASPANLMAQQGNSGQGLPKNASALINLDAGDILITLAHELAHVIGFNPSDCEPSGHFTDSKRYLEDEATFGSKLLFDAYYFEVLFKRLVG